MLTDNDLRELLDYQAEHPVLSIYLNTDQVEGSSERHRLHLRNLLKEIDLPEDVAAVNRYFEHEHDWSGRSVAVFSCAPEGFFRVYSLGAPIRSRVRTMNRPYVKPLADLLDAYGGYGVVLVDKQGGRLFSFHLGDLTEQDGVIGEEVRHTKHGGGSQAQGRKGGTAGLTDHTDEVAERNIREVVDFATRFFSENNVRRILIGGTEDNVALFRSMLPKSWQSLVVGTFPISMVASHTDVQERAMQIGHEAERRREAHLVETLLTNAAKGRGGVVNLNETLSAVRDGRVQTLVIQEGYRAPGCRCTSCGNLSGTTMETCPFCGGVCENIPDAVELAVREVMQSGGDVEVLHEVPPSGQFQQIGALLRY